MVCIFQDIKVMAGPELLELLNHVVFSIIGVGDILILIDAIIVAFIVLSIIGLAAIVKIVSGGEPHPFPGGAPDQRHLHCHSDCEALQTQSVQVFQFYCCHIVAILS